MKRIVLLAFTAAFLALAGTASAASLSIDVPFQFTFAESYADTGNGLKITDTPSDASGFILGASAGWFGVGYERYEVTLKAEDVDAGSNPKYEVVQTYQLYDVFLDLPFPVLNLVLGYGMGTVSSAIEGANSNLSTGDVKVSQTFMRVGLPMGPLFDLHLGYHVIKGEDAKLGNGIPVKMRSGGEMLTVGARLGW